MEKTIDTMSLDELKIYGYELYNAITIRNTEIQNLQFELQKVNLKIQDLLKLENKN